MNVEYKISLWVTTEIIEDISVEQLVRLLKEKGVEGLKSLLIESEDLYNTQEYLSPVDNKGQATIRLFNDHEIMIWSNKE